MLLLRRLASHLRRSSSVSHCERRGSEATDARRLQEAWPTSGPLPITLPPRLQWYCGRASARRCSRPSPPSRLLEAGRLRCHRGLEQRQLQRSRHVLKLRKFGQTFRRQCRLVRSRVQLQRTSRRPQSPNRHSTHREPTLFETRLPAGFTRCESSSRTKVLSAPAKRRSTPLRARKVGTGAPTVGLRIKQARVRKLSGVSDVGRRPQLPARPESD